MEFTHSFTLLYSITGDGIATSYGAGWFEVQIPMRARGFLFSAAVQMALVHPVSHTMGTELFPG